MSTVEDPIRHLAERLPDSATRDEAMDEIHVRQEITAGESTIASGQTVPHAAAKQRFALT